MSKVSFTIKPFNSKVDDPIEIARLHLEVRQGQVLDDDNVFSDILESQTDLNTIEAFYIKPGGNFFIARDVATKQIAGFVGIKYEAEGLGSLKRMAVIKKFRRRGIGIALARAATKWCAENNYSKITLGTGIKEHAKPIYEAVGFITVGMKKDANGKDKDYLMELNLLQPEYTILPFESDGQDNRL